MSKITLITGSRSSGKTSTALKIAESFKGEIVIIPGRKRYHHHFYFSSCDISTNTVVVDDINHFDDLLNIISDIQDGVIVHQKMKKRFAIDPEVILVCADNISVERIYRESVILNRVKLLIDCGK